MSGELAGRLVLVVEDEPLVALHVQGFLVGAGARVLLAHALPTARIYARDPELSAAVLDHGLKTDDTSEICTILKERDIPFVLYSGYSKVTVLMANLCTSRLRLTYSSRRWPECWESSGDLRSIKTSGPHRSRGEPA